jgi:hypothetical protein
MDRLQDYMVPSHLTCLTYERHGYFIKAESALSGDIQGISSEVAMAAIQSSDFAVLTDVASNEGPGFEFPFNRSMKAMQPQLQVAAQQLMVPIKHYLAYSHGFTLYMKPSFHLDGDSGGWVTSQGVIVTVPEVFLQDRKTIELTGTTFGTEYLGKLQVRAELAAKDTFKEQRTEFSLPVIPKSLVNYRILIRVNPGELGTGQDVRIKLLFDKFFVPKNVGMNEDQRELVIMTPKNMRVIP